MSRLPKASWSVAGAAFVLHLLTSVAGATGLAALVAVRSQSPWTLRELEATGIPLVSWDPQTGVAYLVATPSEHARLHAAGFAVATVEPDVDARRPDNTQARELGLYHTYAEMEAELRDLAARFPDDCRLESIGSSLEGRPLWALKISDQPDTDDPTEPDVLVIGCHHAREFMSVEVPLHLARTLLEGAGESARLRQLVDSRELWVVPMLNPDGHVHQEWLAAEPEWNPPGWRKNRRPNFDGSYGVDLNRNYGFQWAFDDEGSSPEPLNETYRGTAPFSEPETDAVRLLAERQRFIIALSYHSFGRLWLYPWGHTRNMLTDDHETFAALADSMVRSNGYRAGNAYTGAIYITNGEFTDYLYGEWSVSKPQRTYAFTPELNSNNEGGFWPPEALIAPTCDAMWPANLFALEAAAAPRRPLPPPSPLVTATQDPADGRHIHLEWTQPPDGDNPVSRWEVFEIAPGGPVEASAASIESSGRVVIASRLPRPGSGRIALTMEARLAPLWDYAYVEARGVDGIWVTLRGDATGDESPTGRNAGAGLTGSFLGRTLTFDLGPVPGTLLDLAVRLDAVPHAPDRAWLRAVLDLGATFGDERRVIAPDVREPRFDVHAEQGGLFAYGVTAIDADGQKRDSELLFFLIPTVGVALHDVVWSRRGSTSAIEWSGEITDARLEVWARPLAASEPVPPAPELWTAGDWTRVAVAEVTHAGRGRLEWPATAAREVAVLRAVDASGERIAGVWAIESSPVRTAVIAVSPNPLSHDGGAIEFDLASHGSIDLAVYGADGRRIRALWSGRRPAGRSRLQWDGRDAHGAAVAAGVYFVQLRASGVTSTRRVVVLR